MAAETIAHIFGADLESGSPGPHWIMTNVFGYGRGLKDDHIRRDWAVGSRRRQFVQLAEMLYHFQVVPGVQRIRETLQNDTIESAIAELEAAKYLYRAGLNFRFVTPIGTKGADFDAQVATTGLDINCELKCKLEETELSEGTVIDTLQKASSQLPKNKPNAIFLKLPERWILQPEIAIMVPRAVRRFYGQSHRIAVIAFHWQQHIELGENQSAHVMKVRSETNPKSAFCDFVNSEMIDKIERSPVYDSRSALPFEPLRPWKYFHEIANEIATSQGQ